MTCEDRCQDDRSHALIRYRFHERVRFNVRGQIYETFATTLERFPETLLGSSAKRKPYVNVETNEINVDCSQRAFDAVLFYYQSYGIMAPPPDVNTKDLRDLCKLFQINEEVISRFCKETKTFYRTKKKIKRRLYNRNTLRGRLWELLDNPGSSKAANLYAICSTIFIMISICITLLLTESMIRCHRSYRIKTDEWSQTELAFNLVFLVEYVVRFTVAPHKLRFVKQFQNVIDLAAITPYFLTQILNVEHRSDLNFLRAIRTIKVLRVLRFSKQSKSVSSVLTVIKDCTNEFAELLTCLFIVCCVCGSIAYYLESSDELTQFTSVPQSMWWAIQTVVCLGYGDIIPRTPGGRAFAMCVAVFGVLTLSIPLLALGSKYVNLTTQVFRVANLEDKNRRKPSIYHHAPARSVTPITPRRVTFSPTYYSSV